MAGIFGVFYNSCAMPERTPDAEHFTIVRLEQTEEALLIECTCKYCGFQFGCDLREVKLQPLLDGHIDNCPKKPA